MIQKCLAVVLALTAAAPAFAAPSAVVEGLALPAWIVRDGRRLPIAPGQAVAVGEAVVTGRGSRALLRLAGEDGTVHATHEGLAHEIGSARAAVSRQLGALARDGHIAVTRGEIRLASRAGLELIAGGAE